MNVPVFINGFISGVIVTVAIMVIFAMKSKGGK